MVRGRPGLAGLLTAGASWKERTAQREADAGRPAPDGSYSADAADKVHLCNLIRDTRRAVKDAYGLPADSLQGDPLDGRTPVAWRVVISGPVTAALAETVERRIGRAIHRGANLIVVQLDGRRRQHSKAPATWPIICVACATTRVNRPS